MSGPDPDALQGWAAGRGLAWQPEDTLPPVTERLRLGVGVGEHRSSMQTVSDRGVTTLDSSRKRPERATVGVCEGRLPGGLPGRLGHHVHLADRGHNPGEGEDRFVAHTDTVVFADLPLRGRPVFHLEARAAGGPRPKAAFAIGGEREATGPLDTVVPAPRGEAVIGGLLWAGFPAEPEDRIRRIVSTATRSLDRLPVDRVQVEYECGRLAVWVKGRALVDGAALDALCEFASGIAEGLGEVDGAAEPIEPGRPLPMPEPDDRTRWVEAGAGLLEWDEPPVSVIAAQERYKEEVRPQATRTGWKVYGIVGVSLFVFGLLVAAIGLAVSWAVGELPIGIAVAIVSVATGTLAANRIGLETGQEAMEDRINSSAIPWGIEAFAAGYARHSGLTREDHEELRHRLEVPFRGRCQIAWQGELAPGRPGHLSIWIDPSDTPRPPRFRLLAATGPINPEPTLPAGYESTQGQRQRLVWTEVTTVQRAIHRLDQLRDLA
ncbi:MAG: hypothetical protein J0H98_00575 [Solirubrobacterales bacterium]|nr:hypothetical protein [Solirubrobacterales bacterium]